MWVFKKSGSTQHNTQKLKHPHQTTKVERNQTPEKHVLIMRSELVFFCGGKAAVIRNQKKSDKTTESWRGHGVKTKLNGEEVEKRKLKGEKYSHFGNISQTLERPCNPVDDIQESAAVSHKLQNFVARHYLPSVPQSLVPDCPSVAKRCH